MTPLHGGQIRNSLLRLWGWAPNREKWRPALRRGDQHLPRRICGFPVSGVSALSKRRSSGRLLLHSISWQPVRVWIGGVWNNHFPESEKCTTQSSNFAGKVPEIQQKRLKERFAKIPGSESREFRGKPFHTHCFPSKSINGHGLSWDPRANSNGRSGSIGTEEFQEELKGTN